MLPCKSMWNFALSKTFKAAMLNEGLLYFAINHSQFIGSCPNGASIDLFHITTSWSQVQNPSRSKLSTSQFITSYFYIFYNQINIADSSVKKQEGKYTKLTFAKTSGTLTGDKKMANSWLALLSNVIGELSRIIWETPGHGSPVQVTKSSRKKIISWPFLCFCLKFSPFVSQYLNYFYL